MIKAQHSAAEAHTHLEAATGIGEGMVDVGRVMQRALDKAKQTGGPTRCRTSRPRVRSRT